MDSRSIPRTPETTNGCSHNPYARIEIPAIGRVWQALQDLSVRLGSRTLQVSIRTLAAEAGLASAGRITRHLKQLEADGQLTYDPLNSIVMLITQQIDLSGDRSDLPSAAQYPASRSGDHDRDRVKPSCMVHESHESSEGVSERASAASSPPEIDDPEWPHWAALGVIPEAYTLLRTDFPTLTLTQFSFWCQAVRSKRSPAGYVIYCLRNRLPLPRQRTQAESPQSEPRKPARPKRGYTDAVPESQIEHDPFANVPAALLAQINAEIEARYGPQ